MTALTTLVKHKKDLEMVVTDHISAMLAYWDKDLVCRFANRAYQEWFGKSKEQMVDCITLPELLGPLLYEKNRTYIESALGGHKQEFEREITMPDGTVRQSLATYVPNVVNGQVKGFLCMWQM